MPIVYVMFMKDLLASDLMFKPEVIKALKKKISDIPYDEVVIDFSDIRSMSPDFANKYKSIKKRSNKLIHEVNMPLYLEKTFRWTQK